MILTPLWSKMLAIEIKHYNISPIDVQRKVCSGMDFIKRVGRERRREEKEGVLNRKKLRIWRKNEGGKYGDVLLCG